MRNSFDRLIYCSTVHNFWSKALMAFFISLIINFCPIGSYAQESFITVDFADNVVVCGPGQTATVTFNATGDTLTNIKGVISPMNPIGIAYEPSSFSSADGVTLMGNMLIFPDLLLGASATFQIDFVALCGASDLTGSNFLEFDFTYRIDGVTEEMVTLNSDDPGFSVTKPGLSFILPSTDMFQPVIGEPDTIVKQIVNGGDGDIDSALYFVLSHPDLILSEIYVEGQDETFATTGLFYSLDFAGASGDTLFYWIGADALQTTGGLDAVWNGIAGMGSSFQESFVIREIWMGSTCAETPPDISRGLGYGCTIGNPLDLCTNVDNNSIVVFDRLPDLVSGQFNWGTARPACYADVNTQVGYYITNIGDAPAEDVIVDLRTSGVGEILEFRYSVGSGGNGMYTAGDLSNSSMGCAGIDSIRDTLSGIDLAVGDTLFLQAEMIFDCSCDPTSCGYAQIYRSNLDVEVIDRCGDVYPGESAFWSEGVVSIGGFAEGPFEVRNGESGCITYTLTGYRNDWFNGNYPLSYYEMDFAFPAGLEMDNSSISWNDSDGTSYSPSQVSFVNGGNMSGDTIKVRWSQAGQPVDWVPSAGSQIEICYTVDCTNPCGGPIDITPSAGMDFVVDPNCISCTQRPVFCPLDLPMRLICTTIGGCMCDGLAVYDLDINRVNYGLGDNDNDKCPEAMESLDFGKVETKRYLQGDTLKANIKALVSGSAAMGQSWTNSTFHLITGAASVTPIGGEFRFYDANTSTTHTCDVLDITVNTSPMGDTISVDLSIAQLNTFCPSISSMLAYEDGDSLELCLFFAVKDEYVGLQKPVLYGTAWSVDDGVNDAQSCNQEVERLTQIGIDDSYTVDLNNDFGGCEDSNGSVRESRFFGAQTFDEFPFEVRELGLPQDFIYVKPSAFSFKLDQFGFLFQGALTGTLVDHPGGDASLAAFIQISGDSLIFKAGDYLRSLGSDKIPSDEGYNASFYPRIQGDCRSVPGIVQNAASLSSSVVDIIFCTPLIQRDAVTQNLEYTGGPQLTVTPDAMSIVVNKPNQCLSFTLTNSTLISAPNTFVYISNPTGNVVVNSLVETTGGMNTPVIGTPLGIYELGFSANSPDRTFEVCVTANTCGTEVLSFVAGWDCNQYPTTVLEATCADPSLVTFTTGKSGLGLLVTKPAADEILELCEEVEYELILNSSMNGSLRDLLLNFDLPIGQEFVPNSLTYQWPQAPPSGYLPGMDPTNIFGNSYELDVSALDAILEADGLPGVDFIPNNAVRIRFRTTTNCDYISGSKAAFFASANNACGDEVPGRFFPSKKVNINSLIPTYSIDVEAEELFLNPCNEDMTIIEVDLKVGSSTGNVTLPGDSVRIILPPGITYSSMSYMPGSNATATGPQIRDLGGQQQLDWMIPTGLSNNAEIDFSFGVTSTDVGQQCRDYKMLVQTYSTVGADCILSGPCEIGVETGSAYISFTIIKPKLVPRLVSGMLFQLPPDEVIFMYTIEVQNNSTIGLPAGTVIPLKLYEDVDNSGTPTSTDILLDVDVLTIDSIAPGRSFELTSTDTFPSGSICAVIAVLDPDTACVCAIEPTNILKPQLKFSFEKEIEVCSGVDTLVGPVPISGYDYTWLSVDGSYLGALNDRDTTQTTFQYNNTSGAPIIYKYALRAVSSSCYEYDTLTVTVYPVNADSVVEPACMGEPILLAGPVEGSNFNWLPVTGLDDPTKNFPVLMNPTVNTRYTVTYDDDGGCPAFLIVDIVVQNCVAGTALGDTVWFDINKNGIYDDGELPIPGVVVLLFPANNPTGPHIRVDTTDANGMYLFDNLSLGQYIVKFIAPDGFLFTLPNVGLDNLDSDADPNTGLTGSYSLNNGDYNATVDAGLISACDLTVDLDVGDCRVSGDTLLRTVTATINWTDAAYTYDYLFGEDTLLVSYLGMIDTLVIDSLDGEVTITFQTNQSAPFTLIAGFTLDSLCADTVTTSTLVPCVFDLALTKSVDESFTTFPVLDNDTVKYKIKVYNQGSVNAENIVIKDHIPCGFSIIAGLGDLATADSTMYLPGPLLPGSADSVCVYLRFQQPLDLPASCKGNDIYTNYTEIFSAEDPYGDNPKDVDSEPNSNSMEELAVTPGSPGDDDILSVGINDIGSEDDHDPAYLEIFDLALKKQLDVSASGPYFAVGDTVKYLLTLYNQGNVIAESFKVIDTIFDGLEFINTSLNPGWTDLGGNVVQFDTSFTAAMAMGLDTFVLGDSVNFCLSLRVKSSADPEAYVNMAQISSATDTNGIVRNEDNDSPYDAGFLGNAGGGPGSPADDFIGGIGTGTPGGTNARGDDDSHDPALFLVPVSIGDTTFVDVNANGIQDAGDVGLPGVTVTLFMIDPMTGMGIPVTTNAFGTPLNNTTITDGMGAYLFDSLPHGQYYVEYDVSTTDEGLMFLQTRENAAGGSLADNDSDADAFGRSDTTGFLRSNEMDLTLDAGWFFPVTIGDTVFVDMNYDGLQNSGDLPLEGVTVTLIDANTGAMVTMDAYGNMISGTTITDADGLYLFDSLPLGNYYVEFDVASVPGAPLLAPTIENVNGGSLDPLDSDVNSQGYSDTANVSMSGDTNRTLDAGFYYPVVLGDTVFVDVNVDGMQNMGDLPLPGMAVTLRDSISGNIVTTDAFGNMISGMTTTDMNGAYLFDSLPPGTYYVEFDVTSVPGMPVLAATFENVNGGSLDPFDSDVNGQGYSDTVALTMSGDTNLTLDAGFYYPVVLGDTVFVDVNYNGLQDAGDLGLADVTVTLRDSISGNIVTTDAFGNMISGMTTTDMNGAYLFDSLPPGTYYVEFDVTSVPGMPVLAATFENVNGGSLDPFDSDVNGQGYSDTVALTMSGDTNLTLDAGFYYPVVLGDTVFVDANYNGLQDMGEAPIEGVTVTLINATNGDTVMVDAFGNPISGMTRTNADGFYLFDSLPPGDYYLVFDVSTVAGMPLLAPTLENVNMASLDPDDSDVNLMNFSDTAYLTFSAGSNLTLDAGYFSPVVIGDTTFVDVNRDGRQGPEDLPLPGITVTLYDAITGMPATTNAFGGPIPPAISDANGAYLFDSLPPGVYYVVFDPGTIPGGYAPTLENVGDSIMDSDINELGISDTVSVLMSGDTNRTLDAGYYPMHSIGNQVWSDANNNGLFDASTEIPIGNVEVVLHYIDPVGGAVAIDTVNTDGMGLYLFDSLIMGTYFVEITSGNFAMGGPLEGAISSSGSGVFDASGGIYEPAPDPDVDMSDGDDNGTLISSGLFVGSVLSDTLLLNSFEPKMEVVNNDLSGALDSLSNLTVDFGFVVMHSIGNQVWSDANNNGMYDEMESPLSDVKIILYYIDTSMVGNPAVKVDSALTDAGGLYLFDSLIVGDYFIEIPGDNFQVGGPLYNYASSTGGGAANTSTGTYEDPMSQIDPDVDFTNQDDNGVLDANSMLPGSVVSDTITLMTGGEPLLEANDAGEMDNDLSGASDGNSNLTVDFGFTEIFSLGNQVWNDANNNGLLDPGEMGIAGVVVNLHYYDTTSMTYGFLTTVTTGSDGLYLFDSLIAGDYFVELPASNFDAGGAFDSYVSSTGLGNVMSNGPYEMNGVAIDEDLTPMDGDDNGVLSTDAGFVGSIVSETVTLGGIEPVGEDPNNDLSGVADDHGNLQLDFGLVELHSIGNQIWVDVNNDGMINMGEVGIDDVQVVLHFYDEITMTLQPVDTILTTAGGFYLFDSLIVGSYIIEIPQQNGTGQPLEGHASSSGSGAQDLSHGVFEDAANPVDADLDVNLDDNGILNLNRDFPIGSIASDTITLGQNEPENEGSSPFDMDNDLTDAADSTSNLTIDFGFVPLHSVGNQLWVDTNNNGIIDPGEGPLAGVTLILHFVDGMNTTAVDTVISDLSGLYLFDSLITGDYFIEIPTSNFEMGSALDGYTSSTGAPAGMGPFEMAPNAEGDSTDGDDNGTTDGDPNFPGSIVSSVFTLDEDEPLAEMPDNDMSGAFDTLSDLTVDFGLFRPVSLGDTTWVDANENGILDDGELPLEGVIVTLYYWDYVAMMPVLATTDAYGDPITTVLTDANGYYTFDSLAPGNYLVAFDVTMANTGDMNAENWQITYQNQGGSDLLDSDADEFTGLSDTTGFLNEGVHDPTLDAGFFAPRFDLALTKGLAPGQSVLAAPGDTVSMWILVANQGNVPSKKYTMNDVLPSGIEFVDATPMQVSVMDSLVQWCDSLPDVVGFDSYSIDTFLIRGRINPIGPGLRDFQFRNWAEIAVDSAICYGIVEEDSNADDDTGYDDDDGPGLPPNDPFTDADLDDILLDSLPGDEDDSDYVDFFTRRFDLAIMKTLSPLEADEVVIPGDTVIFDIKVYNQGNTDGATGIPADNITIVDYVPENLELIEENGWVLLNDTLASKTLEVGDELMIGGLVPDSCVLVSVRFVMNDIVIAETFNIAEIAHATDTSGLEILDFDSDLDSINQDVNIDDALDDNSFEDIDTDGDGTVDEDDSDFAKIITCVEINCYSSLNLSLGPDCMLEVTPSMLLTDTRISDVRPDFYKVTLETGNGLPILNNILDFRHVGKTIKASITWIGPSACPQGSCWSEVTVSGEKRPYIEETLSKTVYCVDPFLQLDPLSAEYPRPKAFLSCTDVQLDAVYVGDRIETMDCTLGGQDTAKIIYREWIATSPNGLHVRAFDTIRVLRLPAMSTTNLYCISKDTLYCGAGDFGPFMILPDVCPEDGESDCDTIYLLDSLGNGQVFNNHCGFLVHVDKQDFGSDGCAAQVLYRVEIKQNCYGAGLPAGSCTVTGSEIEVTGDMGEPLYGVCDFWLIDIDTLPPLVECKLDAYDPTRILWASPDASTAATHCYDTGGSPVLLVSTTTHDCSASVLVPPVCVYENWTGVKVVKATVEGVGSVILERTGDSCLVNGERGYCYASATPLTLSKGEGPIEIVYEVYDSCHNVGTVSCYVLVKDEVKPVAVADKGINVSIGSKKDWVAAEVFEEGSWDNCGLNMVLARRANWSEVCINLCDSMVPCYISEHGDTLWQAVLESDKHLDEVEAHYAEQLTWWKEDGADCGDLLWNAWQYDLMKHATLSCGKNDFLTDADFRHLVEEAINSDTPFSDKFIPVSGQAFGCSTPTTLKSLTDPALSSVLDQMAQIGGGWSDQVPFDCMDACGSQIVEILVIDYWCNWSTVWTEVWVEDKTPLQIAQDVTEEVEISCSTYKEQGIDAMVALAQQGDLLAHAGLDSLFGGYEKAWVDPYGNYVDANGDPIPSDLILNDVQSCMCTTTIEQVREYDDHLGYQWVDREVSDCFYLQDTIQLQAGIVAINCGSNVVCVQEVWSEFDVCGQGYLYRKWKMTQSCPPVDGHTSTHIPDTVTRIQRIWIGNNCELSRYMFTMPKDTVVDACGVTYAADGSGLVEGAADPSLTGAPTYLFDDDCRIVGIGRHDKVFRIVGGDQACQKIIRTWYVADWCGGKPTSEYWWQDRSLVLDSFVQKIFIRDTLAPICIITGPVDDGGELVANGGCTYDLQVTVDAIDVCGLMSYQYELHLVSKDGQEIVAQGDGELVDSSFEITETGLGDGNYILKVRVEDECTNESFCTYAFTVVAGKKPSPVCVTAVTAELTGMDLSGDGAQDTALAIIWASEFNSSSTAACGSDTEQLQYRLDLIDGIGDETFEDDTTYLEVGCVHVGVQLVRMWVIDPSGTSDFCDVQLTVQDNDAVCGSGGNVVTVSGLIETELSHAISEVSIRVMDGKDRERMVVGDVAGAYDFAGQQGSVFDVKPEKDGDDVKGVSTADLILLQKHMLGKQRLESAYELESADVNADGRITALDLITMRRLILGSIDEYPASDSWRFYEEQSKSSTYKIDPLEAPMKLNWIGVKIGDLNHDYDPRRSMTRSSASLVLEVPDVQMEEGRQYRVSFTAENFAELLGYQFTMEYDPDYMEIKSIDYGDTLGLTEGHFNLDKLEAGIVTTSWHLGETVADREKGLTVDPSEVLFSMLIEGKAAVHLSDVFTINSLQTAAEAYDKELKVRSVSLRYTKDRLAEEGFALYQNRPNPFRTETVIGFYLPEAMHARLTIYDASGKLLKVIERDYNQGYQEEKVLEGDLKSHGVIYYQLDTKEFTATRTMVIMD